MSATQALIDMGFKPEKVNNAISACGENLELAMDWLFAHADDNSTQSSNSNKSESTASEPMEQDVQSKAKPSENQPMEQSAQSDTKPAENQPIKQGSQSDTKPAENQPMEQGAQSDTKPAESQPMEQDAPPEAKTEEGSTAATGSEASDAKKDDAAVDEEGQAQSMKCDECGKLFQNNDEVEMHAIKSGHASFSESREIKKPLSAEEKATKMKELEDKMRERRLEREEQERKEKVDREKKRIKSGRQMTEIKQKMKDDEMMQIAMERKREKVEDKLARQRVKDDIARDREQRRAKSAVSQPPPPKKVVEAPQAPKKDYDSTKLQIRFPNGAGAPLVQSFNSKEPLSAVRLWISINRPDCKSPPTSPTPSFNLSTTFPRKIFSDEDMNMPLSALGLVPSAVLVVSDNPRQ